MPAPLPLPLRRRILEHQRRGLSPAAIARQLGLPERTVRALCVRFRAGGAAALDPAYRRPTVTAPPAAVQEALLLHAQHPGWGAPYLLLQLRQQHPGLTDLPSARTLQRWFARRRQPPAPAGRKPATARNPAQRAHEVWQMDAVEQLPLQTGQRVSWLRWVDELTGAVLGTEVFPPRHLRPGAARGGAASAATAIGPLGLAPVPARGQRCTLGELE
jgi:Helix-turn-helix domain